MKMTQEQREYVFKLLLQNCTRDRAIEKTRALWPHLSPRAIYNSISRLRSTMPPTEFKICTICGTSFGSRGDYHCDHCQVKALIDNN